MAWTYSDYVTYPAGDAKVARLRLHLQEVSNQVGRAVSADGKSVSSAEIRQYRSELVKELAAEEARAGKVSGRLVSRANFAD